MLSSLDLYHSPTTASSWIASRPSPSASLKFAIRRSPSASSKVVARSSPSASSRAVKRPSPAASPPVAERASPSGSYKAAEESSSPRRKAKRSRTAQACDVCRRNHRKCNGPVDGSTSCGRCIAQHKVCTWNFNKERSAHQRSTSISPKSRRISIKRSRSTPTQSAQPAPSSPSSDYASPSTSPSSTSSSSSETSSPPNTPQDQPQPLCLPLLDYGHTNAQVGEGFMYRRPLQWEAPAPPTRKEQETTAVKQVLPDFHAECVAIANKYDLLLYALPLNPWEESKQREQMVASGKALYCTTPSWVNPPPSRKEAADILRALLEAESESESDSEFEVSSLAAPPAISDRQESGDTEDESSDEESLQHQRVASSSTSDNESDKDSVVEPIPASNSMDVDIVLEDDSSSNPEPDFFVTPPGFSHFDSQLTLQHPQQQALRDCFDPFLFTPCHCFSTPPRASPVTPASSIPSSNVYGSDSEKKEDSDTFWDEGMPDVLQDASEEKALEECLQFLAA